MKQDKPEKLLQLDKQTLGQISGGLPAPLGPFTVTVRTATVTITQTPGPDTNTKAEA